MRDFRRLLLGVSLARVTDVDVASVAKHVDEAEEKLSQQPTRTWRTCTAARSSNVLDECCGGGDEVRDQDVFFAWTEEC